MKKVKLLDFYADWCGPCKMLTPIINQIQKEFAGNPNVTIEKINIDEQPELATFFQIRAVPTIIIFDDTSKEQESERKNWIKTGIQSKDVYINKIKEFLE